MQIYALDIGGSSIKSAIIKVNDSGWKIIEKFPPAILPSRNFADVKKLALDLIRQASDSAERIGISTKGSVNRDGRVRTSFFKGYDGVSWREIIQKEIPDLKKSISVTVANDGHASAWAEYNSYQEKLLPHLHLVVGTGVGGGVICEDGRLMFGISGQAGYIGHIKVSDNSKDICDCGARGCVQTLASSLAIISHYNKLGQSKLSLDDKAFRELTEYAQSGEENAAQAFKTAGYFLGLAIGNTMNVVNPAIVTVGGGVILASEKIQNNRKDVGKGGGKGYGIFLAAISKGIQETAHPRVYENTKISTAATGNDGGIIGAALLAAKNI